MRPTKTSYAGNCHCGSFRFEVKIQEQSCDVVVCDCRLCTKKRYIWLPIDREALCVVRDDQLLREFQALSVRDKFCNHCGTGVIGEHNSGIMAGRLAVNLRAVHGLNPFELEKDMIQQIIPESVSDLPSIERASEAHEIVACYCGKVIAELLVPLSTMDVREDNCSFCVRTAFVGTYPTKDQVRIVGREFTFEYLHGPGYSGTAHCRDCGVDVFTNIYGPDPSSFDKLPPDRREKVLEVYHKNMALQPLNVRAMEGLDMRSIQVERTDCGTEGYALNPDK